MKNVTSALVLLWGKAQAVLGSGVSASREGWQG